MSKLSIAPSESPFDPGNRAAYEAWKRDKLNNYPQQAEDLIVQIADPMRLTGAEHDAILARCAKTNMAVYVSNTGNSPDKRIPATLGAQLGLRHLDHNMCADGDGITSLQVVGTPEKHEYIPYTSRPIHWHTDGYYNPMDQQVNALLLHCVRAAAEGGENALLDHDIAYIHIRDQNPAYIQALMAPDALTIPANIFAGEELRPARSGPVFSIRDTGRLHMRYTARHHNIIWKQDRLTRAAVAALEDFLAAGGPLIYRLTLQPGWGLISDNVLHDRSGFSEDETTPRLLYRLRYYESVNTR